jgi:hypothetical protein
MDQTAKQQKIALAQSEHYLTIIELMRDCTSKNPIIGENEFKTLVNAITLDVEANFMIRMSNYIEDIRKGCLHEQK